MESDSMDWINFIANFIANMTFPIIAFVMIFEYMKQKEKASDERYKQEKQELMTIITNNTTAMNSISMQMNELNDTIKGYGR